MGRHYALANLLVVLSASALLVAGLAGCQGEPSSTPQIDRSPLESPMQTPPAAKSLIPTPTVAKTSTPSKCPNGCFDPLEGCLIKGVVTAMGDRYYYLPDMEGYEDALLLVKYGGRWFCTEEEAVQNGFEKAPE